MTDSPTVYVGCGRRGNGTLCAVDAATGEQEWAFETSGHVDSSPTVADSTVYIGSFDSNLYAVDAATGSQEWAFTQPSDNVYSSPTVADGTVYVGSADETLHAVDAATGEQEWAFTRPSRGVYSSPTVTDGTVYVGSADGTLYAVDAATGEQEWAFTQPSGGVYSSPTVTDGTVYVGSYDSNLYAVDAATGTQEWAFTQPSNWVWSSPTVADGTVYVGSFDSNLYAVDAATGTQEWAFETSGKVESSPTVVDSTVYVGSRNETLYAVDAVTGTQEWAFTQPSASVESSPTVADGTVYVGSSGNCEDAALYAVDAVTGTQEWAFTQPSLSVHSSPTVVDDPASGDSVGSRVMLGTLGHHGERADRVTILGPAFFEKILDSARQSADAGEYDRALARCERAIGTAKEAREDTPDHVPDIEDALDDATALREAIRAERDAREEAIADLKRAEEVFDDAAAALDGGRLDEGFNHLDDALAALADAGDAVEDHDLPALAERADRLDSRHDDLRNRAETRREAHEHATDALDSAENALNTAAAALDSDTPRDALEALDGVEETLDTAGASIADHELPGLADRLAALEQRQERLRQAAEDAITRTPTTIPTTPRYSLTYDDIEKGDPLGSGGNADVYHATTRADGEQVELALKEPRMGGTLHIETVERMIQEAETWQQLDDHDHIVGVVDYGSQPLPWIGMEYMDTGHLGQRAEDMSFEQKLWTAIATTEAVRHAHRRGVAHLDLKPENILFRSVENRWDAPKVADWGLSKHLLDHSKSVEGMSPHYAAPEQFDDEYGSTDDITDVYQLGAVFYELFTGRPPFEGQTFKVINKIQTETPAPPSRIADVPPALDEILLTALATEKGDRYETAIYLRDAFQQLRDDLSESGRL